MTPASFERTAQALRREFDAGFSQPHPTPGSEGEQYLAIRTDGSPYAIPLAHAAQLLRCPKVTHLPSRSAALLGAAAVRGSLVTMYDLASLLARAGGARSSSRWAVLCSAERRVGIVFDEFEGYLAVAPERLAHSEDTATPIIREVITGDAPRGVVSLHAILDALRRDGNRSEEQ